MKRTTLALFGLMIAMTTFNSLAQAYPSSAQEVASELNRKASESGTRPSTTIDAGAHTKLNASTDYLK
ncbi:hypothetical protein J1781_16040 [Rahnella sp. C60]|uniref:DUF4148 domain-containing protein n=1 Tax=Rahnella perminowiae TaxID=2816244 RepID=A0ABS6KY41_9GAMM|nr:MULTISPECIES: hypothetical protein [Rahnella]UJD88250.1 hypothetical protein FS594_05345 [Rahnella aquatilis]MBU9812769.1 hypothetical protein [Rahnella perminowiae]MBU9816356.1 hypothetical protein [Rahnella perminowiae]MBU9826530.1 hypothetical protein [Rahnella perminowiae]MBU9834434.1 hypothetical protein [Rahnella perminowiae]